MVGEGQVYGEVKDEIGDARLLNVPPLQEFDEIQMRNIRNRIHCCEIKLICVR